ncbi:MAG: hypothetical protein ACOYJS_02620 [Acutalibacteraceae bacterium]|jgi:hypothetical protein
MAISDYLSEIKRQRDLLKTNLKLKNVYVENCTTFNQLTKKVAEIQITAKTGVQNGVWTPTVAVEAFSLSGLNFVPAKLAIFCEDILTNSYNSATEHINIALLNIELTRKEIELLKNGGDTGIIFDPSGFSADITLEETNGLYSVTVSFEEINRDLEIPYKFKANASHVWCVAQEGWLV